MRLGLRNRTGSVHYNYMLSTSTGFQILLTLVSHSHTINLIENGQTVTTKETLSGTAFFLAADSIAETIDSSGVLL